jgi:hypothetical protein
VKDFFRFYTATSKGKIIIKITYDSLIAVTEWIFAGFTRVIDTQTNKDDRSEVYNINFTSPIYRAYARFYPLLIGSKNLI